MYGSEHEWIVHQVKELPHFAITPGLHQAQPQSNPHPPHSSQSLDHMQSRTTLCTHDKLSESSDGEVSVDGSELVRVFTSRWVGRPQAESRTETLRHLRNRVKSFTSQVSDRPRRLLRQLRSLRHLSATHPQHPNFAHGRRSPLLKSAQFSFAFMPLAAGRDPSTSNPVPGRPTPLPAPSHPSCPKFSSRPFSALPA